MDQPIEQLVTSAVQGSKSSLEEIVGRIQKPVYNLALRMLFHPADAEDAAQEILITVITNLKAYRFEGPFMAWVMRIAANKLKGFRKTLAERKFYCLDQAEEIMDKAEARGWFKNAPEAPEPYLEAEMRIACTQAMLLVLDRPHRLAFILGVIMDVSSAEGALILEITPAAFRKRVSRSRQRITDFLSKYCGLFQETNPCRCRGILAGHQAESWLGPNKRLFTSESDRLEDRENIKACLLELNELAKISVMFKAMPAPDFDFVGSVKSITENGKYRLLTDSPKM